MDLATDFDQWLQAQALSASIRRTYALSMREWFAWRSDAPLETTRDEVVAFIAHHRATHAPGTTRLRLIGVRTVYDYLIEIGEAKENPARSVRLPKASPKPVEPFAVEEIQAMLDHIDNVRDLAIMLLLVGGGLRRAEVEDEASGRASLAEIIATYKTQFQQQAVAMVIERSCVSFE